MQNSATDEGHTNRTSWELLNLVLKGLVDELISLGARPQLKLVTLQLWTKYLGKLEIAFTSKTKARLPKFGIHQTAKDYAIIQDHIKRKKSSLKKLLKAKQSTSESHKCTNTLRDKRLKMAANVYLDVDYEKIKAELASSRDTLSEINFRMQLINTTNEARKGTVPTETLTDHHIQFTKRTQTALTKMVELTDFTRKAFSSVIPMKISSGFDPMFLSRQKVLAILCWALFFSKDTIQISDLIRWIKEGHVSYYNMYRLFPEGIKLTYLDIAFMRNIPQLRYKSIQRCVFHISNMMGVEDFPAPNLVALARRFVLELQLPSEMADYVERLMVSFQIDQCKGMMNYEGIVMAFIIVVLKTLFGLDGSTEHSISEFAAKINSLMDNVEESHLRSRLFVWDDWVRYIECRKSTIINKHFHSKNQLEKNLSTDVGPYARYCVKEQMQNQLDMQKKIVHDKISLAHSHRRAAMLDAAAQLPTWKKVKKGYEFPPSLTPQVSYLETILHRNKSGTVPYMNILSYNHTTTSMEFLIQPIKIVEFAHSRGVHVVVEEAPVCQNLVYVAIGLYQGLLLPTSHDIYISIKDQVDGYSKPEVRDRPPPDSSRGRYVMKRKTINYYDDDKPIENKKKKRREKDNMPTSCLNDSYNKTSHDTDRNEGKHSSQRAHIRGETEHNTLTLHIPFSAYWVYEIHKKQPETAFEKTIEPDLPDSFVWLLRECTNILETKTLDLYRVIRQVEKVCSGDEDSTVLLLNFRVRNLWRQIDKQFQ